MLKIAKWTFTSPSPFAIRKNFDFKLIQKYTDERWKSGSKKTLFNPLFNYKKVEVKNK